MIKSKILFAIFIVLIVTSLAQAAQTYNVSNYSITVNYAGGESVKGSINLSFTNQQNKNITSSLGGSISLLNFLNKSGVDFSCDLKDCTNGYIPSNGESPKSFALNGDKTFALLINEYHDVSIKNLGFNVSGALGPSCNNQIYIDLLNDGSVDFYNDNYIDSPCSDKNYGCFDTSKTNFGTINLSGSNEYCEKISLRRAPAYRIGAEIRNDSSQIGNITAKLYDLSTGSLAERCVLPRNDGPGFQALSCIVNYSSAKDFDALICVSGSITGSGRSIKSEASTPKCGYSQLASSNAADVGADSSQADFSIYAYPLEYGADTNLQFNDKKFNKMTSGNEPKLADAVNDYLNKKYGYNCSNGCAIPFSVGGSNQNVVINQISMIYDAGDIKNVNSPDSQLVYSVSDNPFTITMPFKVLDFKNLGFVVPNVDGTKNLTLALDGKNIASQSINIIAGVNFDVNPKFVSVGREIEFTISGYGNTGVTSEWDFGDGSAKTISQNNKAIHKYQNSGTYEINVNLNDGARVSSKTFKIVAGNAKDAANLTINEYQTYLNDVSSKVKTYPDWIQYQLNKNLDLTTLNISLMTVTAQFSKALNDTDYENVLKNLSTLNIPSLLYPSATGTNIPLIMGIKNAYISYLASIAGTEVASGSEDRLKANIASWIGQNYDATIEFKTISKNVNKAEDPILTYFKINLVRKTPNDRSYLIFGIPSGSVTFAQTYGVIEAGEGSGFYIPLDGNKVVEFSLLGKVDVNSLNAYLAPPISKLGTYEDIEEFQKAGFNWTRFLIAIIILLILVLIVYIFLQEWYKRNYESLLFKNSNDLYNLINFIYNSRSAGMKDDEIKKKLSKSGWSYEQINYAFKKIDGKRMGMWEIPLFKFSENKTVRQEIMRRHPEGIDTRFINAQNL
jgi:hypothetical protein